MKRRSLLAALFAAPMLPFAAPARDAPPVRLRAGVTAGKRGYIIAAVPIKDAFGIDLPMYYENGVLKLSEAKIGGYMSGGMWTSSDGKSSFDLGKHTIAIVS